MGNRHICHEPVCPGELLTTWDNYLVGREDGGIPKLDALVPEYRLDILLVIFLVGGHCVGAVHLFFWHNGEVSHTDPAPVLRTAVIYLHLYPERKSRDFRKFSSGKWLKR